jgi:hypothetical protein
MRPALANSLASAGVAVLLALTSANGAFAEDAQFENVESNGTQIAAAGAEDAQLPAKNLNSVPLDGLSSQAGKGPDSPLIRQLMAARPNEDLVICVAGCFSGRDRVVYAQPIDREARVKPGALAAGGKQSANGASDGASGSVTQSLRGSQ